MDCAMPEMNGYEAPRSIRQMAGPVGDIPIIAMTADAVTGDRELCLAAGMNEYVSKPVQMDQLERAIGRFVALGANRHEPEKVPVGADNAPSGRRLGACEISGELDISVR